MKDFYSSLQTAVHDYGAKRLAAEISDLMEGNRSLTHTALLTMVNPNDQTHALSLKNFLLTLQFTSDVRPLAEIAKAMGCDLMRSGDEVETVKPEQAMQAIHSQVSRLHVGLDDAWQDQRFDSSEKKALKAQVREMRDAIDAFEGMIDSH